MQQPAKGVTTIPSRATPHITNERGYEHCGTAGVGEHNERVPFRTYYGGVGLVD